MNLTCACTLHGGEVEAFTSGIGDLPIMVLSSRCNLAGMNARSLVSSREEDTEVGGYFIINGIEKVIRLLQVPFITYPAELLTE